MNWQSVLIDAGGLCVIFVQSTLVTNLALRLNDVTLTSASTSAWQRKHSLYPTPQTETGTRLFDKTNISPMGQSSYFIFDDMQIRNKEAC